MSFTNVQCLVFAKKCLSLAKFCKNIVVCFVNLLAHFIANINMFEILPAVTDFKRTKLSSNVRQKLKLQNYFLPRSSNLGWNFSAHMCENVILIIWDGRMKSWECVRMSDGNLKSWDVPTWWWGVVWVETWQSFITDITDLTDRTLGGTKDGSKGYNSHHSEYGEIYLL